MTTLPIRINLRVARQRLPILMKASFSTSLPVHGEAVDKVKGFIREYQANNFQREIPTRFRKEFLGGVDKNGSGFVSTRDFVSCLEMIGLGDYVTHNELDEAMAEILGALGSEASVDAIPVKRLGDVLFHDTQLIPA